MWGKIIISGEKDAEDLQSPQEAEKSTQSKTCDFKSEMSPVSVLEKHWWDKLMFTKIA